MRDSRMLIGMASAATLVVAALVVGASKPNLALMVGVSKHDPELIVSVSKPHPAPVRAVTPPRPTKAFVQSAAAAAESAEAATTPALVTGVARGGATPKLQRAVVPLLAFEHFQNIFNADAGEARLLVMLSPT